MKILLGHNYYQQVGGEDRVYADEIRLLESYGHHVFPYTVHNDAIGDGSGRRLQLAKQTIWNGKTASEIRHLVRQEKIDVAHFHNTFPLISPAAYKAARQGGAAVVQSLHNYRLLCPRADFLRDGKMCQQCLGKTFPWPSVKYGCYRGSRPITAVVASMLAVHRLRGTYHSDVDRFIAMTDFARDKLVEGGLPAAKISVKPNFVSPTPEVGPGTGGYAFYLGRLSPEKGIETLLQGWAKLDHSCVLKIAGLGPLKDIAVQAANDHPHIELLGFVESDADIQSILANAAFLVLPTINFEGCPKVIIEAHAVGTPMLASRLGAMLTLVEDGRTGRHFEPGNADDLAAKARELFDDPVKLKQMRSAARQTFEQKFAAESNYRQLVEIYEQALRHRHGDEQLPTAEGLQPTASTAGMGPAV